MRLLVVIVGRISLAPGLDRAGMETCPTYSKLGSHLFKSLLLCYNNQVRAVSSVG